MEGDETNTKYHNFTLFGDCCTFDMLTKKFVELVLAKYVLESYFAKTVNRRRGKIMLLLWQGSTYSYINASSSCS